MPIYNQFYLFNNQLKPELLKIKGPVIPVEVSVPTLLAEYMTKIGVSIPKPATGFALVDTGASISAVDLDIIIGLQVKPVGITEVFIPGDKESHKVMQNLFPAKFSFPGTPLPTIEFTAVLGSSLQPQKIIALIGRDVLSHSVLVFNGPGGHISLSF